jgi:hypothetical protein
MAIAAGDAALAARASNPLTSARTPRPLSMWWLRPSRKRPRDADEQVRTKAIDGLLWIDTPAGGVPSATYISQSAGDFMSLRG